MSVNNHNQNNSPGINNNSGHVKATPRLPPRSNVLEGFASGNQDDILTFETAPRSNEKITEPQAVINANGAESNLSYHFPPNSNSNTSRQPYNNKIIAQQNQCDRYCFKIKSNPIKGE